MEEEKNLESPRTITVENNTAVDIIFQWRLTGNTEIVEPGDTIKFTVLTSEDLDFYETQFKELDIEFEEDEPTPPTPSTKDVTSESGWFQMNLSGLANVFSTLSSESWYSSDLVNGESADIAVVLGKVGQQEFGIKCSDLETMLVSTEDGAITGSLGSCTTRTTVAQIVIDFTQLGSTYVGPEEGGGGPLTISTFTDKAIIRIEGEAERTIELALPENWLVAIPNPWN